MKKRNGYIYVVLALVVCLSIACFVTGCSDTGNDEIALAVVGSPHSNAPSFPLNAPSIKDKLYNCCYTHGSVSFITNDGNPKVVYQTNIPKPEKSGLSENKKKTIATGYTNQLLKELSNLQSNVPEVDTLKAISYASKTLSGNSSADKVLVVMDSGLSTVGYLDFTKGLLIADTDAIIEALEKAEAIPDLTDVNVIWMYMGQTAAPQQELSEAQKSKLEDIWTAILTKGGAKSIEFVTDIASDEPSKNLPNVSIVDVQDRTIDVETSEVEPVEIVIEPPIETIVLDNTSVRFIGDKAEFVDYEEASSVLKEYAEILLAHPDNKVYVIGTTATGSTDFCNVLSVNRANAVCEVLIACGVPEGQLIPMGLGYEDPWHIDDVDDNGKQIEEYACQNRKVLIVDVNGDDASKLN